MMDRPFTVPARLVIQHPVMGEVAHYQAPDNLTLAEIIAAVPDLPDAFHRHGQVTLEQGGKVWVVPPCHWARGRVTAALRLKATTAPAVVIRLHHTPAGGRGKGGKSVLAIIASIALVAVGTFITGGGLAPLLGSFAAAGSVGAQGIALAVTFLGRLALTMALKPAATSNGNENQAPPLGQAGASGNLASPGGTFYYCAGRSKVFPHLASLPLVDLQGEDELVEAAYALAGPHQLDNPCAEDTPLGDIDGLTWVVNQGTEARPQSLLARYGHQITPQYELKAHRRSRTSPAQLRTPGFPETDLPKPYILTSKADPDEIWLQYLWPAGMTDQNGTPAAVMPLRIKLQAVGSDSYINLPELMFHSNLLGRISKYVKLVWGNPPSAIADVPMENGPWHSFHTVPAQNIPPVVGGWNAHPSFIGGAACNATARVERRADGFIIYLDPAVFPRGRQWRVWQMRGCLLPPTSFNPPTYYYGNVSLMNVGSAFDYYNTGLTRLVLSGGFYTATIVESCLLMRFATVWNRPPLPLPGDATIEVRGRNLNVSQLSVEASALVPCYDGTGFTGLAPSSNPADHFHHVLTGPLTLDAVDSKLVDLPSLSAWHVSNAQAGRTIAGVFDGRDWRETLDAICAAGLAARKEGRLWGVARQRNTALEVPVERQVFTHLNARALRWTKAGNTVPDAVRVSFRNRFLNWDQDERLVVRPGLTLAEVSRIISLDAVAIDDPDQIDEYFSLYLAVAHHRDWTLSFETWFEGLASEVGDVVGINHIELAQLMTAARISEVMRNETGDVTALVLDSVAAANAEDGLEAITDLSALADVAAQGILLAAAIVTADGPVTQPVAGLALASKTITFTAPFTNPDVAPGQLVLLGRQGEERQRFEVVSVDPAENYAFTLTVVPEAPEIWQES